MRGTNGGCNEQKDGASLPDTASKRYPVGSLVASAFQTERLHWLRLLVV